MTTTKRGAGDGLDVIADAIGPYVEAEERQALAHDRESRENDPIERLRRVRALAALVEIQETRAVLSATADGRTQREIAEAVGKPQTQVHRILRRARFAESDSRTSVAEVILQHKAGAITQGMMLGLLSGAAHGTSANGLQDDGFAPDDWDEIRSAYMAGLLTEAEYESLRKGKTQSSGRRRR